MKITNTKGKMQFAAMSRPKNSRKEWNYMYFWAASQEEAEAKHREMTQWGYYQRMDYKLERIREKK